MTASVGRITAVGATWLTFVAALWVGGDVPDVGSMAVAGAIGAVLILAGFAAASRCRPLPKRTASQRVNLVIAALAIGAVLGLANLGANWLTAAGHPAIRELLVERMATLAPRQAIVTSPILEEIGVRLFLMSVIAWLVSRVITRAGAVFLVALAGSALVFALLHLARPFPGDPTLATYYRVTLGLKYLLAALPLGWIFWRWGLPYAMLAHAVANAAHLALQDYVF